ncbi:BrnA antitoxin family protein [Pleomorphomonas sp. NRK KF1]|uniref:BrnA antitoxin family protein n=1 Tax=Pleomorphomonas sp. NRK KF1 TaxID=2943000 RepID=UPI002043FF85|nr:BrnA antitoxin family protein [Pleomorphomonas sp. NRK KF1]MCM5553953.1 BrnA antitoxin family protein [Pleomorphomonas sp. NRK KF1]
MTDKNKKAEFQPGRGYSKTDWDAVSDSPEATDEELAQAKPFAEVFPELAEKMRRVRGPQKAPTKVSVTLRLDSDIVERFRASGKGWQSRINEILKRA